MPSARQSDQGVTAHPSERWAILKALPPAGLESGCSFPAGWESGSRFPGVSEDCVPTVRLIMNYQADYELLELLGAEPELSPSWTAATLSLEVTADHCPLRSSIPSRRSHGARAFIP